MHYALRRWNALTKLTQAGHLDASKNYTERAGHAAAILYSAAESRQANRINPLA